MSQAYSNAQSNQRLNALTVDTFGNLAALSPEGVNDTFQCTERGHALYVLQADGYVAQSGDVTFANGRVAQLQIKDGIVRPEYFGAIGDGETDDYQGLQDCIDFIKARFDNDTNTFIGAMSGSTKTYRTNTSLNFTATRQPNFTLQDINFRLECTGKIGVDFGGTNAPIIKNVKIYGSASNTPTVGLYYGREWNGTSAPISPNARLTNVTTNGYFSKAAVVNFASEVTGHVNCIFNNKSRSLTSYSYINCGHGGTLDDFVGGLTSDYITVPPASSGAHSNILHQEAGTEYKRDSDIAITITNISNANPAVVTVDPTALTASGLINGDSVYFSNVAGMTQINYSNYIVANINLGAGTFELTATDSSAWGVFTSGTLRNTTGPSVLLNGAQATTWNSSYLLTYGSQSIDIDYNNGGECRDLNLEFHQEASPRTIINVHNASGTRLLQGARVRLLSTSQTISDQFCLITGAGSVRWDNSSFDVINMGTAPTNGMFEPNAQHSFKGSEIKVPLAAALDDVSTYIDFIGSTFAVDTGEFNFYGVDSVQGVDFVSMNSFGTNLTSGGIRRSGDSYFVHNDTLSADKQLQQADSSGSADLNNISSRVNTSDKYAGKMVWNVATLRPVYATGGTAGAVWNYSDGTLAHTPV